MKTLLKLVLWLGGGLVLLVIVGLVIAFMSINSIAKAGIEKGGTWAMGVPTTVSSVSVGWGDFGLKKLNVANPSGYSDKPFLNLGSGDANVKMNSLREPLVEIPKVELADIAVRLEKKDGKANFDTILDNIAKVQGGKSSPPSGGDEKRFVIKELTLNNVNVHYELVGTSSNPIGGVINNTVGKAGTFDIPVGDIKLTNVGQSGIGKSGATLGDISGVIVQAVLSAAAEKGGGILPADLMGDLKGKLGSLKSLQDLGVGGLDSLKGLPVAIPKDAAGAVEGLKKGIGGILGGGDEKDKKK